MKWYEILVLILGALGGFEFVKWLWAQFFNRKNNARIADSEADKSEFHVLQEIIQFLQEQIKEKEMRFAEQTELVRKYKTEILDLTTNLAKAEIKYAQDIAALEIQMIKVKCLDSHCPFRLPPNAYTPPKDGLTKEEYVSARESKQIMVEQENNKSYDTATCLSPV